MEGIYQTVYNAFQTAIGENVQRVVEFLPNIISAILILLIGWIIAKVLEKIVSRLLKTVKIDEMAESRGITTMLDNIGINRSASDLGGRILYWVLLLFFLIPAFNALNLTYVSLIIGQFLAYVPNIIAAILIFIIGFAVAKILAGAIAASAKGAGLEYASAIGLFIKYFITLIVLILGLSQLRIQTDILTYVFVGLLICFGLAVALSLGLGSRSVVSNILAGAFAREHFPVGREIEVQGIKGTIIAVGTVTTSVRKRYTENYCTKYAFD